MAGMITNFNHAAAQQQESILMARMAQSMSPSGRDPVDQFSAALNPSEMGLLSRQQINNALQRCHQASSTDPSLPPSEAGDLSRKQIESNLKSQFEIS